MYEERSRTVRLSDDGTREVVIERWLDRQHVPPRWRSKNWTRKLNRGLTEGEQRYLRWKAARDAAAG